MKVFYYNLSHKEFWDGWIVLWDGKNTYWHDGMIASNGYEKRPDKRKGCGFFYYIGEL